MVSYSNRGCRIEQFTKNSIDGEDLQLVFFVLFALIYTQALVS